LVTSLDRAVGDDARTKRHGSLTPVMRRKAYSRSGDQTELDIRRRQGATGATRTARVPVRNRRGADRARSSRPEAIARPGVVDDFPQTILVSQRELDVIETYLGDLLNDALGPPR
jgi:hypothetical protein